MNVEYNLTMDSVNFFRRYIHSLKMKGTCYMNSDGNMFLIVKADEIDLAVRTQMSEFLRRDLHNGLSFFLKIRTLLQRLLLICLF